jgi:predicted AlkP superfamily pyrophosphatase or phosphodiesterase
VFVGGGVTGFVSVILLWFVFVFSAQLVSTQPSRSQNVYSLLCFVFFIFFVFHYRDAELDMIHRVVAYCLNEVDCRRQIVLEHFGEDFNPQDCGGTCDNCAACPVVEVHDVTEYARKCLNLFKQITSGGNGRSCNISMLMLLQVKRAAPWLLIYQ